MSKPRRPILRKSRLRSISEKKKALLTRQQSERGTGVRRKKKVKARNDERREREFARCYGSAERVEWVKSLPCVACSSDNRSDNHHITGDGAGRKASFDKVVPLCRGCHLAWHQFGRVYVEKHGGFIAVDAAADVERRWQDELSRRAA